MKKANLFLLIVVLIYFTQACSSGSMDTSSPANQPNPTVETIATEPPTQEGTPPENSASYLPAMNLPEIEQFTPTTGAGIKPLFEWQAVDGAAWYALVVKNSEGRPYWAWMGTQHSIYLGGVSEQPGEDIAGPRLEEGMQWAVIAYDSQGQVIAASKLRPISP